MSMRQPVILVALSAMAVGCESQDTLDESAIETSTDQTALAAAPLACDAGKTSTAWAPSCPIGGSHCVAGSFAVVEPNGMPSVRYESPHFALRWKNNDVTAAQAKAGADTLEALWSFYINTIGFPEPFCDSSTKHKVNVHIDPSFGLTGSGTGDRDPAIWIGPGGLQNKSGLAHEFAHSLQFTTRGFRDSPYVGWVWESQAEWMTSLTPANHNTNVGCSEMLADYPHVYYGSTRDRYCNHQFWEFLKDKFCYQTVYDMWTKSPRSSDPARTSADPFTVLARNMGWTASQLNDVFGEWAMHNVSWDYRDPDGTDHGAVYRKVFGPATNRSGAGRQLRTTALDPLDLANRRFATPSAWAPQRWGYNLVRLYPEAGATSVTVTFRGVVQSKPAATSFDVSNDFQPKTVPNPDSDWRWGVVALDSTGTKPRYSALQRGANGQLSFCVSPADAQLWLVVAGTPSKIHKILWDQMYYSVYRYPWMIQLAGAWPEGFQPSAPNPTAKGKRWPNGGGWVDDAAKVDATAYVGPYARVLGGTVAGNARIEDHAVVVNGTISGNAVVKALSVISGGITITDSAKVGTVFQGPGSFEGRQIVRGTAQLYGDVELRGTGITLSNGAFFGFVDNNVITDPQMGANRTAPPREVTSASAFVWRN